MSEKINGLWYGTILQWKMDLRSRSMLVACYLVPLLFFAKPGDLVRLEQPDWGRNGQYRVMEAQVGQDERGAWTQLELAPPDTVL